MRYLKAFGITLSVISLIGAFGYGLLLWVQFTDRFGPEMGAAIYMAPFAALLIILIYLAALKLTSKK